MNTITIVPVEFPDVRVTIARPPAPPDPETLLPENRPDPGAPVTYRIVSEDDTRGRR